jgi:hypothetical protein
VAGGGKDIQGLGLLWQSTPFRSPVAAAAAAGGGGGGLLLFRRERADLAGGGSDNEGSGLDGGSDEAELLRHEGLDLHHNMLDESRKVEEYEKLNRISGALSPDSLPAAMTGCVAECWLHSSSCSNFTHVFPHCGGYIHGIVFRVRYRSTGMVRAMLMARPTLCVLRLSDCICSGYVPLAAILLARSCAEHIAFHPGMMRQGWRGQHEPWHGRPRWQQQPQEQQWARRRQRQWPDGVVRAAGGEGG